MNTKTLSLLLSIGLMLGLTHTAIASGDHAAAHGHDGMSGHGHMNQLIGKPGKAGPGTRVVKVDMTDDMSFSPADIRVRAGETIRFVVRNAGKIRHEMVLGTAAELKAHNEIMKKFPGMEHSEPNMLSLDPGASGEIVWTFTRAGKVDFACLQPGHYEAGMKGRIAVRQ